MARFTYNRVASGSIAATGAAARGLRPCDDGRRRVAFENHSSCPVDRDEHAVAQGFGCGAGTDDARDAEFAADDRGVARDAAAVGHERNGAPQHGNPVGFRHRRDQHLTLPQRFPFRRRVEDANPSTHSSGRGAEPPQKHPAGGTGRFRGGLGDQRGDRPRLHEERAAAGDRPLDVLRGAIVRLDLRAE